MFTAGLGAFLWFQRGRTRRELSTWLLTRGLWLIMLELTVMRLAYNFTLSTRYPVLLLVLWALGACMVALAALVWLPVRALAVVSLLAIVLHNPGRGRPGALRRGGAALEPAAPAGRLSARRDDDLRRLSAGALDRGDGAGLLLRESVPARSADAPAAAHDRRRRRDARLPRAPRGQRLRRSGAVDRPALAGLHRALVPQHHEVSALAALPADDARSGPAGARLARPAVAPSTNPLVVFGRVPLFYFVLHFFAAHLAAVVLALVTTAATRWFAFHPVPSMGGPRELFPPDFGYGPRRGVRCVGRDRAGAVSGLPLVRGVQG